MDSRKLQSIDSVYSRKVFEDVKRIVPGSPRQRVAATEVRSARRQPHRQGNQSEVAHNDQLFMCVLGTYLTIPLAGDLMV
jgi:hypothetical protein